jgi:hypothetical protein
MNLDSSVWKVIFYWLNDLVWIHGNSRKISFRHNDLNSTMLWLAQNSVQLIIATLSPGINPPGHEAGLSLHTERWVQSALNYTSIALTHVHVGVIRLGEFYCLLSAKQVGLLAEIRYVAWEKDTATARGT